MPEDTVPSAASRGWFRISLVTLAGLIGFAFLCAGFTLEIGGPKLGDYIESFRYPQPDHTPPKDTTGNTSQPTGDHETPQAHLSQDHFGPLGITILFLKEAGVAFLVAAIVGWAIERKAHERDNERAEGLRQGVAENAIFAIYGLRHTREFINTVVETNLQAKVVRQGMELDYEVRTPSRAEATLIYPGDPDGALQRFAILEMKHRYTLKNVSSSQVNTDILYSVPLRQGEGARAITEAHYVSIGGKALSKDQIKAGARPKKMIDELAYEWPSTIPAGGAVKVVLSSRCIKERSDNEVWGCMFPTLEGMKLTLSVPAGMRFGVRPISSANLVTEDQEPSDVTQTWTLDGPLLRHNSLVLWWRTTEDEGKQEPSPPPDYSQPIPDTGAPAEVAKT